MQRINKLYYFLCVAVPAAALIFLTVSCEYIVDPEAPARGEIVITSKSSVTDSDTPGYFSATGVLNIEEGVVTDYEWEVDYIYMDYNESKVYFAQSGYIDFTGAEIPLPEDPAPRTLKYAAKNNDGGWYSNLDTMRIYKEQVRDYDPVEVPEITPDLIYLYHDAELVWENDKISEIKTYYYYHDGYTYGYDDYDGYYTPEYYLDMFSIQAEKFPYWKTEFIYNENGNLERTCSGAWDGESVGYSYVSVYSGYDEGGNPGKETVYSGAEYPRGEGITQYPENIAEAEVTEIDFDVDWWPNAGNYFIINSHDTSYNIWFRIDGSGTDPFVDNPFYTGIQVNLPVEFGLDTVI